MSERAIFLIKGQGKYVDDISLDNQTYLYIVRSPYARARIRRINSPSNALLFLTGKDLELFLPAAQYPGAKVKKMPVLADGVVNFYGQPVAAVITENRYDMEDVAEEVSVEYEPLEPSLSIEEPTVQIYDDVPKNISNVVNFKGGELALFRESQVEVTRKIEMSRVVANPMETKGVIANYHDDVLDVFVSSQSPFGIRNGLSETLQLAPEKIRVYSPDVGGAFGNKSQTYAEYVIASIASIKLGRPVKWIETRTEHLNNPVHGKGMIINATLFAKWDGTILGLRGRVIHDIGAYNFSINTMMASFPARLLTGPYKMRFAEVEAISVFTNLPPTGPYRGAGRPEAALIHETLIEELSKTIGMDSLEIRKKNLIKGEYTTPLGLRIDEAGYQRVFELAEKKYREMQRNRKKAALVTFSALIASPPGESAKVRLTSEGVEIIMGTRPHGQDHEGAFLNLASTVLGIDKREIKLKFADTPDLKEAIGTFGSRSITAGGASLMQALLELKKRTGDNLFEAYKREGPIEVDVFFKSDAIFAPGAYVISGKLNEEECRLVIDEIYAVDDVGKAYNPDDISSQIYGGVVQGIGEVISEEAKYGKEGIPLFSSISDAGVFDAVMANFRVTTQIVEYPSKLPHGARGVGESGTIGAMAAAFVLAEKLIGRKINRIPIPNTDLCK
ncbi:aldehyde oxidase [Sulfolobales archaeon HS-7]|nr:aldehyde oxidase [Sulfolobales archaeon HS-7]